MKRRPDMRILPGLIALLLGAVSVRAADDRVTVTLYPVPVPAAAQSLTIGKLRLNGTFELRSPDPRFGGLSGLDMAPDGRTWAAVSDTGMLWRGRLDRDEDGRIRNIGPVTARRLSGPHGETPDTLHRDAEAVLALPSDRSDVEEYLIAFERDHRIDDYWLDNNFFGGWAASARSLAPEAFRSLPFNKGLEALTLLADGRLLALSEAQGGGGWLLGGWEDGGAPHAEAVGYAYRDGFSPTDMTTLPDGNVLVLERRSSLLHGYAARILLLPHAMIQPGAVLAGKELARIEPPLPVDNMEGIAAARDRDGKTHIYLISDDNFRLWQRSLWLDFIWPGLK